MVILCHRLLRSVIPLALGTAVTIVSLSVAPPATSDQGHGNHGGASDPDAMPHHPHGDHSAGGHHHGSLEIPPGQPIPTISIDVIPDPINGWNLQIQTTHFTFAPQQVNQANRPGMGHAHLYINGEKRGRIYSSWYHLPQLPPGDVVVTVGLNANGHEALTHNGNPIEATVTVPNP